MIRTIIIDDEPNSRETLELMLRVHAGDIHVLDSCNTPAKGIESIHKHQPDLVFLDIEMPGMNGFEMLKKLSPFQFDVVFTTAYDQYAVHAIRISALDYLQKPIDPDELRDVINRFKEKKQKNNATQFEMLFHQLAGKNSHHYSIALPTQQGLIIVKTPDILRLEANGSYTKFFLLNKETVLVSRTLKEYEELLRGDTFFRVHESHIINLDYLKKYIKGDGGQVIMQDGSALDVARRRKDEFLKIVSRRQL